MVPVGQLVESEGRSPCPSRSIGRTDSGWSTLTADVAGAEESPVYAILDLQDRVAEIELRSGARLGQLYTRQPGAVEQPCHEVGR